MAWVLIVCSLVLVWVACLCKILHGSSSPLRNSFLNTGGAFHKRNVLLVIAHPDDESMFFSPTISYLTSTGHNLHVLCLSADWWGGAHGSCLMVTQMARGMSERRARSGLCNSQGDCYAAQKTHFQIHLECQINASSRQECSISIKVPLQQVKIIDHPDLQDGFGRVWNHTLLANIIEEEIMSYGIDSIITFDYYGVSGHCNHRDVHYGVCKVLNAASQGNIEAWELVSTNVLRKYSGPLDIWLSILHAMQQSGEVMHCLLNQHPQKSFLAMAQHSSQWVWFRKLFVAFSSYTYVNTLRKIKCM